MKLFRVVRMIMILYVAVYITISSISMMTGKNLKIFSLDIKPSFSSAYFWIAMGSFLLLGLEQRMRSGLMEIPKTVFLGIILFILILLVRLYIL